MAALLAPAAVPPAAAERPVGLRDSIPVGSALTIEAVKPFGLGNKDALRCKNMWTLGLALWMFDRDRQPLIDWLNGKFAKDPNLAAANVAALNAGHAYGETAELGGQLHKVHLDAVPAPAGLYRTITGAEAVAQHGQAGAASVCGGGYRQHAAGLGQAQCCSGGLRSRLRSCCAAAAGLAAARRTTLGTISLWV